MSYFNMVCYCCGREVFGCNIINGMKFCAKCYQETFGNQQNKESSELLVNFLAEKDKQIAELQKQLKEKEKCTYTGKEVGEIERKYETQLEEKEKEIKTYRQREYILMEQVSFVSLNVERLEKQLKSQPAEIVEKIRNICSIEDKCKDGSFVLGINEKDLDNLLKEYQK